MLLVLFRFSLLPPHFRGREAAAAGVLLNVLLLYVGAWYEKRSVIGLIEKESCRAAAYTLHRRATEAVAAMMGVVLLIGCLRSPGDQKNRRLVGDVGRLQNAPL